MKEALGRKRHRPDGLTGPWTQFWVSVHRLNANGQLEEQVEDLTNQRKDLWEFHVSHDVPFNLHSSQDFSISPPHPLTPNPPPLLRPNILGETLTPLFMLPLAPQLAAFPHPLFHT